MTRRAAALILVTLAGCRGRPEPHAEPRRDGGREAPGDASSGWPELAEFRQTDAVRVIVLPTKTNTPKFELGGPVVASGLAVVSSSQFGFIAIDYQRGQIAWTKPAGLHVAPPLARGSGFVLIGECVNPPEIPDGEGLLGCLRVVTPAGADQGYVAIHGKAKSVESFATELGPQRVTAQDDRSIVWRRGDRALLIDQITGVASETAALDPPIVVHYKDHTWEISRTDEGLIVAKEHGKVAWQTQRSYTALHGAVYLPGQSPMIRTSNAGKFGGHPELNLFDIDATGSMHGQVAFPVPGIGLAASAIDSVGDLALAVQLDASLERDFIVGYAANALLMWTYPLPRVPRVDPVGLAIAPDAVLVFHDGDTLTVLPELSAPPTAPGAARAPLENPTP